MFICGDSKKAFCAAQETSPGRLCRDDEQSVTGLLVDADMEEHGYAGSYVESNLKAVKSWLRHGRIKPLVFIKTAGVDDADTNP
jgi:hypothetical protein